MSISSAVRSLVFPPAMCNLSLLDAEGVLVAKKDFNVPKHNEIDTKNLYVSLSEYALASHMQHEYL